MHKWLACLLIALFCRQSASAQDSVWTLQSSIQYALTHNIDMRESVLNARLAKLQWEQSRLSQIPNVSLSANYGKSYGRSVDPTTNQFINSDYNFAGITGNADVLLFGWFQKRKAIAQDKLSLQASLADYDQLKDDVSLNVATGFLRILQAKEQIAISREQMKFSEEQEKQTQAFVNVGRSPELDLAQMQSQVASDSASYYAALNNYQHAILDMKALINLDIASPFDIVAPEANDFSLKEIMDNTPEQIYLIAKNNFNSIKSSQLKVAAARKGLEASKAALYPQLGLGFQSGTNYASTVTEISNPRIVGSAPTGDYVEINGAPYPVMQPEIDFSSNITPFFRQLKNNLRQTVALNLTIPIFNGWTGRNAVSQAKINIENNKLEAEQAEAKLKQDVYAAYYDAQAAAKKYHAARKAADASDRALDFAQKRYQLGLMNAVELLTTQNTNFKTKSDAASAKYDLIFKLKVIDYYLGKELHL